MIWPIVLPVNKLTQCARASSGALEA